MQAITSTISDLTGTHNILDVPENQKRRFVLQKDYNEYFFGLLDHFNSTFPSDLKITNIVRSLLILIQNNIFYSKAKFIKLIKFYKLNWKDDVRILANSNAFKAYLLRVAINNHEKKLAESPEAIPAEDQLVVDACRLLGRQYEAYDKRTY